MKTKRSHEGYLVIDHRACPGLAPGPRLFESATITCSHCHRVVVLNPDRSRERGYCPKCDHYVCDECELARVASGGHCRPMNQIIEEIQNKAEKGHLVLTP